MVTIFWLRHNFHRDTVPVPFYEFIYRDKLSFTSTACTATAPVLNKNLYHDAKNHAILALYFLPGTLPTELLPALLRLSGFAVRRGQMGK
jgi:hypothetical protein